MSSSPPPPALDHFDIGEIAGKGGMGIVYRARDRRTGAPVALKVIRVQTAADQERFLREGKVLADLRHPGIVAYVEHGATADGQLYLAMEWLEGEDLRARLSRHALPIDASVRLARQVAATLGAVHARGLVHRDIKPSNIFLVGGKVDRVKLLDFGVVRLDESHRLTQTGVLVGTPGFMAPEQARGQRDIDARADVFSLGCVLYACLAGRAPFVGPGLVAMLAKTLLEDPPSLREQRPAVPEALEALLSRLLEKDRDARPANGKEVDTALASLAPVTDADGPPSLAQDSLAVTGDEQRYVSVAMCMPPDARSSSVPSSVPGSAPEDERLRAAVAPFGARIDWLADGTAVVTLASQGTATDQAVRAARCALAMRSPLPRARVALATGRMSAAHPRAPVGEVIDRASELLRIESAEAPPSVRGHRASPIVTDDVTAALLGAGFDVSGGPGATKLLLGERETGEVRTLLGKLTPCVGRELPMRLLLSAYDECVRGPSATALLVTSAAGMGKSRLRYEFLDRVAARPDWPEVWIARGDPLRVGSPFGLVADALRRLSGVREGESPDAQRKKLRALVARHVLGADLDRVSSFLGEIVDVPFPSDDSAELEAARQSLVLMGDQMQRAWEDLLAAECADHPVVLVLEDLHWGDLPSVKLVDAALRNLSEHRFLVLALARPEVHALFPRLWAERGVMHIRLDPLDAKACERLAREVVGSTMTEERVQRLAERSAGNAFYLEELLRSAVEGRTDAPDTVLAMAQSRFERLDGESRRVLRAASVFGDAFWRDGVAELLGDLSGAPLDERLAELARDELITRRSGGRFPLQAEYAYRHGLLREAAYATLTDRDRQAAHRVARAWLSKVGESEAMVLAEHCERGGEPLRAVRHHLHAAEHALEGNDFATVISTAGRAIACGADEDTRASLKTLETEARYWLGDYTGVDACGAEALTLLRAGSRRWCRVMADVLVAAARRGDAERLSACTAEALEAWAPEGRGDRRAGLASLLAQAAAQNCFAGRLDVVRRVVARIEELAEERGLREPSLQAWVEDARSTAAMTVGSLAECVQHSSSAAGHFRSVGDVRNAAVQQGYTGYGYLELGLYEDAEHWLRDALAASRRLGLTHVAATAEHNLGLTLAMEGRIDEARATESSAIRAFELLDDQRLLHGSERYMAKIELRAGDFEAAERWLRRGLPASTSTLPSRAKVLAALSRALLARGGRQAEARAMAAEAYGILEIVGSLDSEEAVVRLAWAEALQAGHEDDPARVVIAAARDWLVARAARISDPDWRASFLERVPENARILKLAGDRRA